MRLVRTSLAVAALLAVAAVAFAYGTAQADHSFPDVPEDHAFHDAIANGFDVRCFTGFNDGTFRPGTNPTRGQFAYWLNNCTPRSGFQEAGGTIDGTPASEFTPDVALRTVGAEPGGTSLVLADARVRARVAVAGTCTPCELTFEIARDLMPIKGTTVRVTDTSGWVHASVVDRFALDTADDTNFSVRVSLTAGTGEIEWNSDLVLTATPWEADGTAEE